MGKSGLEIWGIHRSCQAGVDKINFKQQKKKKLRLRGPVGLQVWEWGVGGTCAGEGHLTLFPGRRGWPRLVGDWLSISLQQLCHHHFQVLTEEWALWLPGCSLRGRPWVEEEAGPAWLQRTAFRFLLVPALMGNHCHEHPLPPWAHGEKRCWPRREGTANTLIGQGISAWGQLFYLHSPLRVDWRRQPCSKYCKATGQQVPHGHALRLSDAWKMSRDELGTSYFCIKWVTIALFRMTFIINLPSLPTRL